MLLYTRRAAPKVPKKRSRAGCTFCKEKKKKCDEKRPQCDRCLERGQPCVYEPVRPRVRRKREPFGGAAITAIAAAAAAAAAVAADSASSSPSPSSSATITPPGDAKMEEEGDYYHGREGGVASPAGRDEEPEPTKAEPEPREPAGEDNYHNIVPAAGQAMSSSSVLAAADDEDGDNNNNNDDNDNDNDDDNDDDDYDDDQSAMPTAWSITAFTRAGAPLLFPDYEEELETAYPSLSGVSSGGRGRGSGSSNTAAAASTATATALVHYRRHPQDLWRRHPTLSPLISSFVPGPFSEFSDRPNRRALVDHFSNVLSHLIVLGEETANPFQQLVLPLGRSSPAVMSAIYALASAHLEYRAGAGSLYVEAGRGPAESSVSFHSQALQGLSRLIEDGAKARRNELLAAIMLLVYYEVLVQRGRSNIVNGHLRGAMTVINNKDEPPSATGSFLERAFNFYDVIAALSFGTAPLSSPPVSQTLAPFRPLDIGHSSPLSNVDALLGMANTLWPAMHRLSGLKPLKNAIGDAIGRGQLQKAALLRAELEAACSSVETALSGWQPSLPVNFCFDDDCADADAGCCHHCDSDDSGNAHPAVAAAAAAAASPPPLIFIPARARVHSILNSALAYRHSALIYLHRTILGRRRDDGRVQQHVRAALAHCVGTVASAGPMGALLWPLFVASCEAATEPDRAMATRAFGAVDRRQGMTNIGRAWGIVREVWRLGDEADRARRWGADAGCDEPERGAEGAEVWRRVCDEMGIRIVFG